MSISSSSFVSHERPLFAAKGLSTGLGISFFDDDGNLHSRSSDVKSGSVYPTFPNTTTFVSAPTDEIAEPIEFRYADGKPLYVFSSPSGNQTINLVVVIDIPQSTIYSISDLSFGVHHNNTSAVEVRLDETTLADPAVASGDGWVSSLSMGDETKGTIRVSARPAVGEEFIVDRLSFSFRRTYQ